MKTPKSFTQALAQTRLPSVFNPYADCCPTYDRADAAHVRRRNLVRCLEAALAAQVDTIWIARDLGYRGGRRTGVPLTDEVHLGQAAALMGGITLDRATRGPVVAERTAAIVWSVLTELASPRCYGISFRSIRTRQTTPSRIAVTPGPSGKQRGHCSRPSLG